jgi:hypothetical protein
MTGRQGARAGRLIALGFASLAMIGSAVATSANTDITDIWWNKNKSGNGVQIVNTGTFAFATGYLYGQNLQPFWFSAELELGSGPGVVFSGPVYVTSGPYYGGPYDPATVTFRQAGTMTFVLLAVSSAELTYTIDGVTVTEPVERQPLTLDFHGGLYTGVHTVTTSGCFDPGQNNVSVTTAVDVGIVQNESEMTLTRTVGGNTCTYEGTYSQLGRMGTLTATYSCTGGGFGTALIFQMTNQPFMLMARTRETNDSTGCTIDGELVGVIPR